MLNLQKPNIMKKGALILGMMLLLIACGSDKKDVHPSIEKPVKPTAENTCDAAQITIDFMNKYVAYVEGHMGKDISDDEIAEWILSQKNVDKQLAKDYKTYMNKVDFLDFDPILHAQDFPEEFEVQSVEGDIIYLTGRDWKGYKNQVKIKDCKIVGVGVIGLAEMNPLVSTDNQPCSDEQVAVQFLNDYIDFMGEHNSIDEIGKWLKTQPNVAPDFADQYDYFLENVSYPDVDPILNSQDYPEQFILKERKGEIVTLTGKDWGDANFLVQVKDCKVTGAGLVNIQQDITEDHAGELSSWEKIQVIRSLRKKVDDNLSNYTLSEIPTDESTEGGSVKIYVHHNKIKKVNKEFLGEMGKREIAYYFNEQGGLSYVLESTTQYNSPIYVTQDREGMEAFDPKKSVTKTNKYFIYNDTLIQWLLPTGGIADYDEPQLKEKEAELLEIYLEIQ